MTDAPQNAVAARNLTKEFRLRAERRRFSLIGGLRSGRRRTLRAVDDLTFDVARGEVLGIVGMNGSGKSSLLKLLAGVTTPTSGSIKVRGRVGSLIEVGAGFHPELSGYENVYLNGSIQGLPRERIDAILPEVVAFSGLEGFMDMPVKHYSSGMFMRLGFAISIQIDPDVLLLDETLSVGDASFQPRALKAISDFRTRGVTTLLVSHDPFMVRLFCDRVLWMHEGAARRIGPPDEVLEEYFEFLAERAPERAPSADMHLGEAGRVFDETPVSDAPVAIEALEVRDESGAAASLFEKPERLTLAVRCRAARPVAAARLQVALLGRRDGALILEKDTERDGAAPTDLHGEREIRLTFDARRLHSESLRFVAALREPGEPGVPWARASVDFDLVQHAQPTPDSMHYPLAPCDRVELRALAGEGVDTARPSA